MGKYHPLPSHPFLFSPSLVLFQEHWFLASSQTFQSCVCLRDFVMTVPSDWKILPLDSHTSHVSLPSGLCSNISFSVRPTWLPHFNCNSTTRIPDMFSLVLFLTISISYFHTLLFHLSHLHSTMLVKRQSTPADAPGSNTILKIALRWLLGSRWINKNFPCVKIKAYYLKKLTTFVLHFISTKCILIFPVTVVTKLHKAEI